MRWVNQSAERFQQALLAGTSPDPRMQELVTVARAFPTAASLVPGPRPEFVAALRERLMSEAATLPARPPAPQTAARSARPARAKVINVGMGAVRKGLVGAAAASLVVAGVGVASRTSIPGGALYPVKQLLDDAAIKLADPGYARGMTYLAQAQEHISDTRALTGQSDVNTSDVTLALTRATESVTSARSEFSNGYELTKAEQNLLALPDFSARALPQIDALEASIPAAAHPQWQTLRDMVASFATSSPQTTPGSTRGGGGPTGTIPGASSPSAGSSGASQPSASGTPPRNSGSPTGGVPTGTIPSVPKPSVPGLPLPTSAPKPSLPDLPLPPVSLTLIPTGLPITPTIIVSGTPTLPPVYPFNVGDTVYILSKSVTGTVTKPGRTTTVVRFTLLGVTTTATLPNSDLSLRR